MPDFRDDPTLPATSRADVSAEVAVKPAVPSVDPEAPPTQVSLARAPGRGVTLPVPVLLAAAVAVFALGVLVARLF